MALEIQGRIVKILALETGDGKNGTPWQKRGFVIETEDQYPKKICFNAWGDKVQQVNSLKDGDKVKVSFDVSSREYNEKWFTDLRPWKIESAGSGSSTENYNQAPTNEDFGQIIESDSNDDLPF
jgi:hypothetical protein